MNFKNTIFGAIITTIGVAIGYFVYFTLIMFNTVALWISNYFNAPDALAFIITLSLIIVFAGLLITMIIVSIYIIIVGLIVMLKD